MSAKVTPASPATAMMAPGTSTRPPALGSFDSGTWRIEEKSTRAPSGMLMTKIHLHDAALMRYPPRSGPAAVATPPNPDHEPMARLRSTGSNDAWMMARLPGVKSAAPIPWRIRVAMRMSVLGESAHVAEAIANHTTPTLNTSRLPLRSPSDPPSNSKAASARV